MASKGGNFRRGVDTVLEMRPWLLFALGALGCGAAPPVARAPAPVFAAPVAPEAPSARAMLPALGRSAPPNRCLPNGLPVAAKLPPERAGATCRDHSAAERRLRSEIAKRFQRSVAGKLEVSFGCDPLVGQVTGLAIETGYGHGGSLQVWRVTRGRDASSFDVLGVAADGWIKHADETSVATTLLVARAAIRADVLERALSTVRPALTAVVREIEPPPLPNALHGVSMFTSSGNFHQRVWLGDDLEDELEASYTGYPNSATQRLYLGLEIAREALEPLFENFEFRRESADADLRAWFSEYLVRAWPRLQQSSAWWVRERLVVLAGKAGDASVVPMIVSELERGLSEVAAAPPERSRNLAQRYLEEPLAALKGVTGWDPRLSSGGSVLWFTDAAREAVRECKRGAAG